MAKLTAAQIKEQTKKVRSAIAKHKRENKEENFTSLSDDEVVAKLKRVKSPMIVSQGWGGTTPGGTFNYSIGLLNPDPTATFSRDVHVWVGSGNADPTVGTFLLNVDPRFPRLTQPAAFRCDAACIWRQHDSEFLDQSAGDGREIELHRQQLPDAAQLSRHRTISRSWLLPILGHVTVRPSRAASPPSRRPSRKDPRWRRARRAGLSDGKRRAGVAPSPHRRAHDQLGLQRHGVGQGHVVVEVVDDGVGGGRADFGGRLAHRGQVFDRIDVYADHISTIS